MFKVEIKEVSVAERNATNRHGASFAVNEQEAYVYLVGQNGKVNLYPSKMLIKLQRDQEPYPEGVYLMTPDSVYINRFGQLEIAPRLEWLESIKVAA